jgi:hypothetical protein
MDGEHTPYDRVLTNLQMLNSYRSQLSRLFIHICHNVYRLSPRNCTVIDGATMCVCYDKQLDRNVTFCNLLFNRREEREGKWREIDRLIEVLKLISPKFISDHKHTHTLVTITIIQILSVRLEGLRLTTKSNELVSTSERERKNSNIHVSLSSSCTK